MNLPRPPAELLRRYEVPGPRYTSYPTVPEWTGAFGREQFAERLELAGRENPGAPLSLYVHIPFCRQLCTYCGCNVVISRDGRRADRYLESLAREMDLVAERLGGRRSLAQIHWGGGTPNFLDLEQIATLWRAIGRRFALLPDAEVAVEVNPITLSSDQLSLLRSLGFNRLSIGVQDFAPEVQQAINRIQGVEETRQLLEEARRLGFGGVNFDLIYGLPHQTPASFGHTLEQVIAMRPDRLAIYSFAYLPEVRLHQRKIPAAALPTGQSKLDLFRQAYEALVGAGYRHIGMDHFALPGDELSVAQEERRLGRNFQGYTVVAAADTVAFGITGISDVHGAYAQNVRLLPIYYDAVDSGRLATERGIALSADDRRRRAVITQLMCNFWVDLGPGGLAYFARELDRLRQHERDGLLAIRGTEIELTPLGRLFVRNVAMVFDAYLGREAHVPVFSRTV